MIVAVNPASVGVSATVPPSVRGFGLSVLNAASSVVRLLVSVTGCGLSPLKYRKTPTHDAPNHEAPAGETADLKVMGQAN